jgi:hypothetical protein
MIGLGQSDYDRQDLDPAEGKRVDDPNQPTQSEKACWWVLRSPETLLISEGVNRVITLEVAETLRSFRRLHVSMLKGLGLSVMMQGNKMGWELREENNGKWREKGRRGRRVTTRQRDIVLSFIITD